MRRLLAFCSVLIFLGFASGATAQEHKQEVYKTTARMVERTTKAINYEHRGATWIDFRGTELLPKAHGMAHVDSEKGYTKIEARFDNLKPASGFGPEYLTYVLWAITPGGRPENLGELILDGDNEHVNVTTNLLTFGMIVTAEPYFAVSWPSDAVVMENATRSETKGTVEMVDAKYELFGRGEYIVHAPPAEVKAMDLDKKVPLDLYQARNAVRIAHWMHADVDAADSYKKAEMLLRDAESAWSRDKGRKAVATSARAAVQAAEDARTVALKRQEAARIEAERAAAAEREALAKSQEAEAKLAAANARAEAERARIAAETEAQRRLQAEQEQKLEIERRARAEAEQRLEAERRAQAEAQARTEADRAARATEQLQNEADRARQAAAQAEQERQALRNQLNVILETRETIRGLIVNMSDVLFDTAQYTLKPGTREKLSKIAGILQSHPGIKLKVEGHTDSVGGAGYNQRLSEQRAEAVRDYLVQSGIRPVDISARGMGKDYPIASNDSAAGRQLNRRVELVITGDVIGRPNTTE
jgi:outer membrane protein OmpA-like peptidoglycan-associated protein